MSRNIQIREPGNLYQDVLHPETNSGMVLMENGSTLQEAFDAHKAESMPHITTDASTGKIYRYGIAVQNGVIGILYEEVL